MLKILSRVSVCGVIVLAATARLTAQNLVGSPGFETGPGSAANPIPGWTFTQGPSAGATVIDNFFPHSGGWALDCQQVGGFDSISQNLTTVAGQSYDLSFWLGGIAGGFPGTTRELRVWWNGAIVMDRTNDPKQFNYIQIFINNLVATSTSTTLQFDIRNDPDLFFLDDIAVIPSQRLSSFSRAGTTATLTMNSSTGYSYQLQRSDTLLPGSFVNLGSPQLGNGGVLTFIDSNATNPTAFYRVLIIIGSQANPGPLKPLPSGAKLEALKAKKRAALRARYFEKPNN